jgi:ABC-type dipeptide/oligopeptide/nickel transport system permease component
MTWEVMREFALDATAVLFYVSIILAIATGIPAAIYLAYIRRSVRMSMREMQEWREGRGDG